MRYRKLFTLLVLCLFTLTACTAYANGNDNDLAYIAIDELVTESSVATTDGVIVYDPTSFVPMQGVTVADIVGSDSDGGGTSTASGFLTEVGVKATTDQTAVLATDSGKTFIATLNTKYQLPACADGLVFTFVTGSNCEVEIQVATTPNTITFAPPEIGNGNGVIETAGTNTTGNTVTLYSNGTTWFVSVPYSGTERWTDGGAWTELDLGAQ